VALFIEPGWRSWRAWCDAAHRETDLLIQSGTFDPFSRYAFQAAGIVTVALAD
jgi:hypothetical protein